jgi:hypothetical protein
MDSLESDAWVGRQQAFALIASKCSAAQAHALKEIKESRAFEQLGLTWEEFCLQHVGLRRERADALIHQFDEFGEDYFRLSQIARISAETYRQVAPKVERDTVNIDGEEIELTLPNAARIRAAIKKMRQERNQARRAADFREPFGLADLRHRHDAIVAEARSISYHFRPDGDRQELLDFVSHATPGSDGPVEKTLPRIRRAGGPVIPCNRRHDGNARRTRRG